MASAQQFKGWLTDYMKQASVSVSRTTAKNYGKLAQKLHELSASRAAIGSRNPRRPKDPSPSADE
jgi:hypothetical protein